MFRSDARELGRTCVRDDHVGKLVPDGPQTSREHFSGFQESLSSKSRTRESVRGSLIPITLVTLAASALQALRFQFFGPFESFLV